MAVVTLVFAAAIAQPGAALAQTAAWDGAAASTPTTQPPTTQELLRRTRAFTRTETIADCRSQADTSGDIVVCGGAQPETLPLPEVYGPAFGSTDGAAVDPAGVPCGASISGQCYAGVGLPQLIGAGIGIVGLLLDPERNLGEGTPIPDRFRGANR